MGFSSKVSHTINTSYTDRMIFKKFVHALTFIFLLGAGLLTFFLILSGGLRVGSMMHQMSLGGTITVGVATVMDRRVIVLVRCQRRRSHHVTILAAVMRCLVVS